MCFHVVNREAWFPPDTPAVPGEPATLPISIVPDTSFQWNFTLVGGRFLINGLEFDAIRVDHVVLKGNSSNDAANVAAGSLAASVRHPLRGGPNHVATAARQPEPGRVPGRAAAPQAARPPGAMSSMPPQNRVVLRLRFADRLRPLPDPLPQDESRGRLHDGALDIVDSVEELTRRRREIDERRMLAGLPPQYLQQGGC